ncbi:MAG: RDD family protein [Candidatus Izemoplasmataceae bacterium]
MNPAGGILLRRIGSFIIDMLAIAMIVNFTFTMISGPVIQEYIGYEEGMLSGLVSESDEYTDQREAYEDKLENDDSYTEEDFEEDMEALDQEYNDRNRIAMTYIYWTIFYHFGLTTLLYYVYSGIMKGQTFGRRLLKIYMSGHINWWTLFMREVLWKSFFWVFIGILASSVFSISFLIQSFFWIILLPLGIWIDVFMILSTRDKKTLRDKLSGTRILFKDIIYPF